MSAAQPTPRPLIVTLLDNIRWEHTVFALPFAYIGAVLAAGGLPRLATLAWITLAMVSARTAAMSFNRAIDARLDALNPRTAMRPIPAGQLSQRAVVVVAVLALLVLIVAAAQLNPVCLLLSPVALAALVGYSYTKRFTWLCHFVLGFTDGIAPAGGWLAVRPLFTLPLLLLVCAVAVWIAGFDIIYACQDVAFDRQHRIASIPARFGIPAALRVSTALHVLMIALLIALGLTMDRSWLYYGGVAATALLLFYEHRLITPRDMSRINLAFFTINSYIAGVLFVFTMLDLILSHR
jgi:4-hydroxybenzoate polyprenyltransferase